MASNGTRGTRPVIRGRMNIVDLAQELERLRASTLDVVTDTNELKARATKVGSEGSRLELAVPEYGLYPLTEHGHKKLAQKADIPISYYDKLRAGGLNDLLADNVNAWLGREADRRLVRIADGKVRAVLSDRYRVLDNFDLAMMVMERAKEHAAEIQDSYLTETRMYIKLVVPEFKEAIKAGDDIVPGLVVSNSEVGDGAFRVEPFLYRLVCSNGLIGETSLYKVHLGARLELGELIYSDETRQLADRALWSQVRDIIDATFDTTVLRAFVDRMRITTGIVVRQPQEAVDVVVRDLSLSEQHKNDLLRYFGREGDTLFGLVNGVTRLAQDFEDVEKQVDAERYAGTLVLKPTSVLPAGMMA